MAEGSTLGGRIILKHVIAKLNIDEDMLQVVCILLENLIYKNSLVPADDEIIDITKLGT